MSQDSIFRLRFLFAKYLDNDCSPEQLEELFKLLENKENYPEIQNILAGLWAKQEIQSRPDDDGQARLYRNLMLEVEKNKTEYFSRRTHPGRWYAIAASIVLIAALGSWFLVNRPGKPVVAEAEQQPSRVKQVQRITLSDGSIVELNRNSRLSYPAKFSGKTREVYLVGEGYFDIKHDPAHPFYVHAKNMTVKVLGTAFNINAYPGAGAVKVTVTRGKVQVYDTRKALAVLLPNQQISYDETSKKLEKAELNAKEVTLWKEPDLVLDDITLADAVKVLSDRYGKQISLESEKIKDCHFSASFLNTTSLDAVLTVIARLNNLTLKTGNDGIVLSGPGCN